MIFGIGGVGGAILGGLLSDALGERAAIIGVGVPANLLGGALPDQRRPLHPQRPVHGRRGDPRGRGRAAAPGGQTPTTSPCSSCATSTSRTAPCRCSSASTSTCAGARRVALLGTNGAGKSTVLRVISGLGIPSRGIVRLNGHTVTLCSPETRVRWGIHQLPGRQGRLPAHVGRREPGDGRLRVPPGPGPSARAARARRSTIFPELRDRLDDRAGRPLRRPAADARPGHGADARPRDPAHRRALPRPGAGHGRAAPRRRRSAEGRPARR